MDLQNANSPLAGILKNTVIPWVERDGMAKIFTAEPVWHADMELPEGMTTTRKPMRGKRVATRGGSAYGKTSAVAASWPKDHMHAARAPKLCFILAGPVAFRVNNYVLHCQPGHGILLPPGTPFSNGDHDFLDQDRQHRGVYEMFQILPYHDGLACWLSRGQQDAQGKIHKTASNGSVPRSKVPFYLHQLMDEALKKEEDNHLICNGLLSVAIGLLHRELQQLAVFKTGEIHATGISAPGGQRKNSIMQAQEYIESNLREPLSIDRVARFVCMSRTVFTAQFRAKTGKTFSQYIQDLRMEEARKLLRETDLAVSHLSIAVGLQPHRMRVLFHEHENMSPLEFRRHQGKK